MSINLYLTSGKMFPISTQLEINDETFSTDEDILDYFINSLETTNIYKITSALGFKKTYIVSSQICKIECK